MRRTTRGLCAALLLFSIAGCRERVTPPPGARIRVASSSSSEKLARALIQLYVEQFPTATVELAVSNSRIAREAVEQGKADVALISARPAEAHATSPRAGPVLESEPIAMDGIAVIVSAGSPVRGMSLAQIRDVFEARALDWHEVGGTGEDIQTVSREAGSGTREEFERIVMAGRPVTSLALVMPGTSPAVDYVAGHPNAIAYASTACLTRGVRALVIEGQAADPEGIRSGAYPLAGLITLVHRPGADTAVRALVEMALSASGQDAATAAGYVSLR